MDDRITNIEALNTALDEEEIEARYDGNPVRKCGSCGDHFVVVDGRWYLRKATWNGGQGDEEIWCHQCSEQRD